MIEHGVFLISEKVRGCMRANLVESTKKVARVAEYLGGGLQFIYAGANPAPGTIRLSMLSYKT